MDEIMIQILWILLAIFAGVMIPVQTSFNTALSKSLGSPFLSSLVVFIVAAIAVIITIAVTKTGLPGIETMQSAPWWSWFGGILGGAYIVILIFLTPKLGVGTVTGLVVAGQIIAAVIIDHFGLLNFPVHELSIYRIAGVLMMIGGVILVRQF
jgi:bacterial/archaeal transporter family-2 protein